VTVLRVRGYALPSGDPIDLYADGDRWTDDPVPGAALVAEGWLLPGLVDTHTHLGAAAPGDPFSETLLREDLREHVAAGVTILAGTDSRPHGRVAVEIRALAAAGVSAHRALGAGSWSARAYLGLGGLEPGAPADAVVYDADPRDDLDLLDSPRAVILRGVPQRKPG
jgi:imidazolonepropionase-like amidohydrolase